MTYSPNIPQAADIPSQSQSQILTNFQQLNTIFSRDHFAFDDATSNLRGHHQFVQLTRQAADPVVSISPGGCIYGKQAGGGTNTGPFWESATTVLAYSMQVCARAGNFPLVNGTNNINNFAGLPTMAGYALAIDVSTPSRTLLSPFYWDGTNITFPGTAGQLASGSTLVRFTESGSQAQIVSTAGITVNVRYFGELT